MKQGNPITAMDVLSFVQGRGDRYLFTVRVYRPSDPVPKVPVRLTTYGYNS
jgi:hypothetical protein